MSDEQTDYEKQRRQTNMNAAGLGARRPDDHVPTPMEFLINKMGGDPSQDILILCPVCGITLDPECSYGGWHDESMWLEVRLADVQPASDE